MPESPEKEKNDTTIAAVAKAPIGGFLHTPGAFSSRKTSIRAS